MGKMKRLSLWIEKKRDFEEKYFLILGVDLVENMRLELRISVNVVPDWKLKAACCTFYYHGLRYSGACQLKIGNYYPFELQ